MKFFKFYSKPTVSGICAIFLFSGCVSGNSAKSDHEQERPNILLIVTDDMGYTDLGAFGGEDIPTPNLDRLAGDGLRLTQFRASPSCAPTRAMLMSGTGNHEAGLGTQLDLSEFTGEVYYERYLHERYAAMPEVLRAAGYMTLFSGKWHLGKGAPIDALALPGQRGFARSFALLEGSDDHDRTVFAAQDSFSENGTRLNDRPDAYSTTLFTDKLNAQIASLNPDQPMFAVFAPTAPHWPLRYPPGTQDTFKGQYDAGYDALCTARMRGAKAAGVLPANAHIDYCPKKSKPWKELSTEEQAYHARLMEIYAAMTAHLDSEIGRILAQLEESGRLDNTYIIYMNDNGAQGGGTSPRPLGNLTRSQIDNSYENLGHIGSWSNIGAGWADAITAPFRGSKASQYEGGIRVPAFVWHKNMDRAGSVSAASLTVMDIMPTVLELSRTQVPDGELDGRTVLPIRGKSFVSLLRGDEDSSFKPEQPLVLDSAGRSVLIDGNYKIVRDLYGDWELFDLSVDPGESQDLSVKNPKKLSEMTAAFDRAAEQRNYIRRSP